jgi:hypothetical protein
MNKLIVAIVTAVTLASTSLAFAETRYRSPCDPYAGTYWEGVAPYGSTSTSCDPYDGTIWEGVAPYCLGIWLKSKTDSRVLARLSVLQLNLVRLDTAFGFSFIARHKVQDRPFPKLPKS